MGAGLGPTASGGLSVELSSVSSSEGGGSSPDADTAAQTRKCRLQLRAVHSSLKEKIKKGATKVGKITLDKTTDGMKKVLVAVEKKVRTKYPKVEKGERSTFSNDSVKSHEYLIARGRNLLRTTNYLRGSFTNLLSVDEMKATSDLLTASEKAHAVKEGGEFGEGD